MHSKPTIRLPRQWPRHVKAGMIHAIALASTAIVAARGRVAGRHRLRAELDRANEEIALLREELDIKDGRWRRSRTRRRPHYSPEQRMRILQLRAARGWTMEKTARTFLLDLHTLQLWMRRLYDDGDSGFLKTSRPVNRFPDFVRVLVRELKRQLPTMGTERIAQVLAREGLALSAATIRRVVREPFEPPSRSPEAAGRMPRRAVARRPGDVWHVDLTAVPMKAGFWTPSFPFSLPQRWPFCWWVAVVVDQMSRKLVGFAVFKSLPTSEAMQQVLDRAIAAQGRPPRCIVTDKGSQFKCRSYRRWCKRRRVRARFGYLGEPFSIAVTERFIRSMKQECFYRLPFLPLTMAGMRRELTAFCTWYNEHRPHTTLEGRTPDEIATGRLRQVRRIEPRPYWRHRSHGCDRGDGLTLDVSYVDGRKHLPVVELRRAA